MPFFAEPKNGTPDFRLASADKAFICNKEKRCWICGGKLGRNFAFVLGGGSAVAGRNTEAAESSGLRFVGGGKLSVP